MTLSKEYPFSGAPDRDWILRCPWEGNRSFSDGVNSSNFTSSINFSVVSSCLCFSFKTWHTESVLLRTYSLESLDIYHMNCLVQHKSSAVKTRTFLFNEEIKTHVLPSLISLDLKHSVVHIPSTQCFYSLCLYSGHKEHFLAPGRNSAPRSMPRAQKFFDLSATLFEALLMVPSTPLAPTKLALYQWVRNCNILSDKCSE